MKEVKRRDKGQLRGTIERMPTYMLALLRMALGKLLYLSEPISMPVK